MFTALGLQVKDYLSSIVYQKKWLAAIFPEKDSYSIPMFVDFIEKLSDYFDS